MNGTRALSIGLLVCLSACGGQTADDRQTADDSRTADQILADVNTSGWAVRPEDYGFTVQEYLHAEHDLFMLLCSPIRVDT